jgi:hypothetical protein
MSSTAKAKTAKLSKSSYSSVILAWYDIDIHPPSPNPLIVLQPDPKLQPHSNACFGGQYTMGKTREEGFSET